MSSISSGSGFEAAYQQGGLNAANSDSNSGGGSFYLGGDEEWNEEEEENTNPELVLANQGEADSLAANRQFVESLILDNPLALANLSPWSIDPLSNLRTRGHRDLIVTDANSNSKKFLINA